MNKTDVLAGKIGVLHLKRALNRVVLEHHTADDTLTTSEASSVHTNLGASGTITLTLPPNAPKGISFKFVVMAAQALRIAPGSGGAVYIGGAKQTDNKYVYADDEAESVELVSDGNGDWSSLSATGTWGVEG